MNKRILELAEQAGVYTELLDESETVILEKFAELIVRECAEYVDTLLGDVDNPHYPDGEMIKEHFGVEE